MASKLITIDNLVQGMRPDDYNPGTLRDCVDFLPWRGSLRRRGPITSDQSHAYGAALAIGTVPSSTHYARMARRGAAVFHNVSTSTGRSIWNNGLAFHIDQASADPGRMFDVRGETVVLPGKRVAGVADVAYTLNGPLTTAGGSLAGTGTVDITQGSKSATFSTTTGASEAAAQGYFTVGADTYQVEGLPSSTTALLVEPARTTTGTHAAFTTQNLRTYQVRPSAAGSALFASSNASAANVAGGLAGCYHQGRVFFGNIQEAVWSSAGTVIREFPYRIRWSALANEGSSNYVGEYNFDDNAYHDVGAEGGKIYGLASLAGALVVIREFCIQTITGGFASSGADIGASDNTVASGIGAKGVHAWRQFEGGIAFADENGCYVWDGSQVTNLTSGLIETAWRKNYLADYANNIIVSTPGNRIVIQEYRVPPYGRWFVFDSNHKSWQRMNAGYSYSNIVDIGTKYLCTQDRVYTNTIRSYDFKTVFEDLGWVWSGVLDVDSVAGSPFPYAYIQTNPVRLGNGFDNGRVLELILNDGGYFGAAAYMSYDLLRGPIYGTDYSSREYLLAPQSLGTGFVTKPVTSVNDQKSTRVRVDGSDDASHVTVVIRAYSGNGIDQYDYAINAIGLVVEDNPSYDGG